jgi:hypothetical protein
MKIKGLRLGFEVTNDFMKRLPRCEYHREHSTEDPVQLTRFRISRRTSSDVVTTLIFYGMGLGPGKGHRLVIGA